MDNKFESKIPNEKKPYPLISEELNHAIDYVNAKFLSQPYTGTFQDEEIISTDGKLIPRPNHGLAHSLRVAAYIPLIIDFHKKHSAPEHAKTMDKYTPEKIKILQIAALFSVVGRKDEKGFMDSREDYRSYRQASADAFEAYCKETNLLKDAEEIEHYKTVVLEMGNTAWLHGDQDAMKANQKICAIPKRDPDRDDHFLHMAHSMDLFRVITKPPGLQKLYELFNTSGFCAGPYHQDLLQLLQFPAIAITNTGSRLSFAMRDNGELASSFKEYDVDIFSKTNTDTTSAVTALNSSPRPSFVKDVNVQGGLPKETANTTSKKDKQRSVFESFYLVAVKEALEIKDTLTVEICTPENALPYLKITGDNPPLLALSRALLEGETFGFDAPYDGKADHLILTIKTIKQENWKAIPYDFLGSFDAVYHTYLAALSQEPAKVTQPTTPTPPSIQTSQTDNNSSVVPLAPNIQSNSSSTDNLDAPSDPSENKNANLENTLQQNLKQDEILQAPLVVDEANNAREQAVQTLKLALEKQEKVVEETGGILSSTEGLVVSFLMAAGLGIGGLFFPPLWFGAIIAAGVMVASWIQTGIHIHALSNLNELKKQLNEELAKPTAEVVVVKELGEPNPAPFQGVLQNKAAQPQVATQNVQSNEVDQRPGPNNG